MADPLLHIKDGYFFQFPKSWITYHWHSLSEVPPYVRADHPEASVQQINQAMAGKWLIPQWFGTPKSLYQPGTGFCISRFMLIELLVAIIMCVVFIRLATRARDGERPRGTIWNMLEAISGVSARRGGSAIDRRARCRPVRAALVDAVFFHLGLQFDGADPLARRADGGGQRYAGAGGRDVR